MFPVDAVFLTLIFHKVL